jgi:hypothetical protein
MNPQYPNNLEQRIEELEKKLAEHQHLGMDGSKELGGETKIGCNQIIVSGVGVQRNQFAVPFFRAYDVDSVDQERRMLSQAVGVTGKKGTSTEQTTSTYQIGKGELERASNIEDWEKNSFSQLTMVHRPVGSLAKLTRFGKNLPVATFLLARRTPIVFGRGVVSGNKLTDLGANFKPGKSADIGGDGGTGDTLLHGILCLKNDDFNLQESRVILEVTKNEIICEDDFTLQGEYNYEVVMPVVLGSANVPFSLGYFGDGLRFGYGVENPSDIRNTGVSSLTWGKGSPEGKIRASQGSLYLNQSGGAGTTFYVKETGQDNNTGWIAK